ncbi:hypothetical protein [Flavobacterium sp. GCM10023249]|uniref:hypothetical protein n=1 Tax=unclassified Flavobacterium TaxID=196869 RepID=UPI00360D8692
MKKFNFKKNEIYKINVPSEFEIETILEEYCDFSNFKSMSPILNAFSFDSEKFDPIVLSKYTEQYELTKSYLYFYDEKKDLPIRQLSVKQKIFLNIMTVLSKYDCIAFSFESLSENTKRDLIYLFNYLCSYKEEKTFVTFDYSNTNHEYRKLQFCKVTPTWGEEILES